jgi:IclR family transcriptional regulator, acetate operon repressor
LTGPTPSATILKQAFHIVGETGTQAIDRAAALLVRVVESATPLAVGELAQRSLLPKSTTSRLVAALERHGLVQRTGDRGPLCPGPVLLRFAQSDRPEANLVELARPPLARLAEASGETINLGVSTPLGVEHLAQEDSRHYVGGTNWVGRRVPHDCTANGKVFLAFGAARVPAAVDERVLETIRARGYATAVDELEQGLSALAAPVFGPGGRVVAALSISGPTIRLTSERMTALAPLLAEQVRELSSRLGYPEAQQGAA